MPRVRGRYVRRSPRVRGRRYGFRGGYNRRPRTGRRYPRSRRTNVGMILLIVAVVVILIILLDR
jgi:hypothetical protein